VTGHNVQGGGWATQTSTTLLARVKAHDPEGWRRFVHLYGPLIFHWCRQAGLQDADAADVGQDVFRAVARTVADFRREERGTFRGWLRTITRNKVRDLARHRARDGQGEGGSDARARLFAVADAEPDADDEPERGDDDLILLRRAVDLVLADFAEQTRRAFLKIVVDEQDPTDVARELGMTINAVYLAKSRVMRRLRDEFGELLDR
jgi:RNA polymerase sigma-70 factor (ECF subfamily)